MDKMYIGTKRCIHCNSIMQLGKDVTCERCIEILRKDMLSEETCKHKSTVKAGITLCKDGIYQRRKCKECAAILKGDKIK